MPLTVATAVLFLRVYHPVRLKATGVLRGYLIDKPTNIYALQSRPPRGDSRHQGGQGGWPPSYIQQPSSGSVVAMTCSTQRRPASYSHTIALGWNIAEPMPLVEAKCHHQIG